MGLRMRGEDDQRTWIYLESPEGEDISRTCIVDRQMRIGCARVRMGGIGGVGTSDKHRMKGYSRLVLTECMDHMTREGYDVSLLFGITRFYPKWGYATSLWDQRLELPTEALAPVTSALKTRAFRRGDMPAILRIHNAANELRTGSLVRPPFPEDRFPMGTRFGTTVSLFVVLDSSDRIIGYAGFDKNRRAWDGEKGEPITDEMNVCEVGASDIRAWDAILQRLAREARKRSADTIRASLPADHEFVEYTRSFGVTASCSSRPDGGPMMRIMNLLPFLHKLEPEFARRTAGSGLKFSLGLATDIGDATVKLMGNAAKVSPGISRADTVFELQQWKLIQLIMGYRSPRDVLADPREAACKPEGGLAPKRPRMSREALAAAEALFPRHYAFCWHPDWF